MSMATCLVLCRKSLKRNGINPQKQIIMKKKTNAKTVRQCLTESFELQLKDNNDGWEALDPSNLSGFMEYEYVLRYKTLCTLLGFKPVSLDEWLNKDVCSII
jgi:hypothetical protein